MKLTAGILTLSLIGITACSKRENNVSTEASGADVFRVVLPTEEQKSNPVHGEEAWFAYGAVAGISPELPISGIANVQYFQDGTFALNVRINSPVPAQGNRYDGWISDGKKTAWVGTFTSATGDVRMGLTFEMKNDYRSFQNFLVTLETDERKDTVGKMVAKGMMKEYKR